MSLSIPPTGVQITDPALREFTFKYEGTGEIPDGAPINYEWGLSLHRLGLLELGVEFTVGVAVAGLEGRVVYRVAFELDAGSDAAAEPAKPLTVLATRLAPQILYPYVREVYSSAAHRAGVNFTLPIQNVGALFSPDQVQIPEAPGVPGESIVSEPRIDSPAVSS
jgi:hypothetical protein